ncbi:PLP-dependent aminotransferase family protein [Clostridium sp. CF012]|uniref:aminotransferase-like domain-containing protein n=1 Tax=Clostridium sp. CF012 TaxID=2843319 RepID=UPI001C0E4D0B|nr:PLP-dependent aminotransferase family protein [Clostridium sp. CF012]MBU3146109.1 PLP-dependent aminotransferase family protein [Clostridium sp. CF012]
MPVNSFIDYPMSWTPNKINLRSPLYKSIAIILEEDIRKGVLNPGDKLPPQRELADFLDINLSTVTRAFKICELKGLISGTTGKGTYISSDVQVSSPMLNIKPTLNCIDMGASHPPYEQNKYVIDVMNEVLKKKDINNLLKYSEPLGRISHKINAQKWLQRFNLNADIDNIMIASGLQNALCIILMSLFQRGDKIATDQYIYPGFKSLANVLGIRLIPIPYANNKMNLQAFNKLCKNESIKGLYIMSDCNNPTTYTLNNNQRISIAKIVRYNNLIFIEDASYSFLTQDNLVPISSIVSEQSIYISSVSNALCVGLRVSFLVVPNNLKALISDGINNVNVMTSPFDVEIISRLIESGLSEKIIEEKRARIVERNVITDRILKNQKIYGNKYSQFRWLELPLKWVDGQSFEEICKYNGVLVYCGEKFAVANSKTIPAVRIAICSPNNIDELKKGLKILNSIIKK